MADVLISMANDELVAQGYLIIRQRGLMVSYIPTEKYRDAMSPQRSQAMVLHSTAGTYDFNPEEVYYICGECGENLYPHCSCPLNPPKPILCGSSTRYCLLLPESTDRGDNEV